MEDETLRMLRDAVCAFTKDSAKRVRKARESEYGFDKNVWGRIAEQGWISALVSEDKGGLGLGCAAANVVANELGRAAIPEPYVAAAVLPATLLSNCQASGLAIDMLALIASGDLLCAVAWQSESGSLDPLQTPLKAIAEGSDILITGTANSLMTCGMDAVVAVALRDGELAMYWVPIATDGVTVNRERRADWGYDSSITFDSVRVSSTNLIDDGDNAINALGFAIDTSLVAAAAELTGVTERMLELTLDYLKTRTQFGKQIGSFQALKHRAVDLWMHTEISKAATAAAAEDMDDVNIDPRARSAVSSGAKARASDTSLFVGKQAVQMHGAIGVTDEYDLSLYFNKALVLSTYLGNGAVNRSRYASMKGA
ncbi:acyl-CoA dehydrogenase family protein [Lacisediminimonas profundi]|uniref:acyl-CoA dehydrogenase family protein n=1 Tax=Lacisediminimonas profundi TaxID=2603856 RepID=UPI00124B2B3A|nr:acyl-CoA dehydrogenase family protein [Lacisediminimonas profundi]